MTPEEIRQAALARVVEFARAERQRAGMATGLHLAKDYHSGLGHVEHFRNGVLPRLRRCGDMAGCRVLEVGAGVGFMAAMLATTDVGYVVATDADWATASPRSAFVIEALQNISTQINLGEIVSFQSGRPEYNGRRLAFVQADGARLPFANERFDVVFTHGCLEHIGDLEGLFAEMLRVLKPGGLLYSETEKLWGARDGSHFYEVFPAPWAHLLADAETLWQLYSAEYGGKDILWEGRALDREFFVGMLTQGLNRRGVRPIKKILAQSGYDVVFWQQMIRYENCELIERLQLRRALAEWPMEELLTGYLAFGLRKQPARWATTLRLRCPLWMKRIMPEWVKRMLR